MSNQKESQDAEFNVRFVKGVNNRFSDMKTHNLKCWPEYFGLILRGRKTFELRRNDRDFKIGDTVELNEWEPEYEQYTGRRIIFSIIGILHGGRFGLEEGYCILSFHYDLISAYDHKGAKI